MPGMQRTGPLPLLWLQVLSTPEPRVYALGGEAWGVDRRPHAAPQATSAALGAGVITRQCWLGAVASVYC